MQKIKKGGGMSKELLTLTLNSFLMSWTEGLMIHLHHWVGFGFQVDILDMVYSLQFNCA